MLTVEVLKKKKRNIRTEITFALAGVAQIECWPANQRVAGSIPSQGTRVGCRPGPQLGVCRRQPIDVSLTHQCFSPSLSLSLPLSVKINK